MCWPPLITVLVDNNRAHLEGMEIERKGRELKLITASIGLSPAQPLSLLSYSLTLSPSVCVDFLQCHLQSLCNILRVFHHRVENDFFSVCYGTLQNIEVVAAIFLKSLYIIKTHQIYYLYSLEKLQ